MRDKEEIERTTTSVLMNNAFETGEILKASEETLQKYLQHLCTGRVPNEEVRHREIIRALTINHIQAERHIDKLGQETERLQKQSIQLQIQNNKLQKIVIWLAVVATVTMLIQISMLIWPPRSAPPTPIQEQNTSRAINSTPVSSPKGEVFPPSKPMPPQATFQSPRQNNTTDSGTPSQSTYKDQKPTQSPPYEKKK